MSKTTTFLRLLMGACLCAALLAGHARASDFSDDKIKIGLLTDMSGTYSDLAGPGTIVATEMAIEDFGGKVLGRPIEMISADHQNKPDIAANKARDWADTEGVDVFAELVTSSVALAVNEVARQTNKISIVVGSAASSITGQNCTPTGIH